MPHVFLVNRVQRGLFEGKINFNETLIDIVIHTMHPLPLQQK